jgi:glycosyltransferase involved in cell wall biosynthesis
MITAVVLTHNNQSTIGRTLGSLLWCDERVVIDDFSTDRTLAIAKNFKTKIYKRHLCGDFAAQRNYGLSKVKGPVRNASHSDVGGEWVLFVDSDEVVSTKLRKEILAATASPDIHGFFLKRQDYLFGKALKHGEVGRMKLLRLGRKGSGTWMRPVHETWNMKGITGQLSNPLYHFPHPNVAQFLDGINTYSTLNAQYLHASGVDTNVLSIIAYPTAKFFLNYIWRLGFLDGTAGIIVAIMMSFHSFLTRAKLYMLWKR